MFPIVALFVAETGTGRWELGGTQRERQAPFIRDNDHKFDSGASRSFLSGVLVRHAIILHFADTDSTSRTAKSH
jgi:hypothetical protein